MENNGTMKRVAMAALVLLFHVAAVCAQGVSKSTYNSASSASLNGTWVMDKATKERLELKDDDVDMDCVLRFSGSSVVAGIEAAAADEEMSVKMVFECPGTYTRQGKKVTTKIDKSKGTFKITSLTSTDPDMKKMLADESMRKLIYEMVEKEAREQIKDDLDKITAGLTMMLETFEVESVTASKLTISREGETVSFDKRK